MKTLEKWSNCLKWQFEAFENNTVRVTNLFGPNRSTSIQASEKLKQGESIDQGFKRLKKRITQEKPNIEVAHGCTHYL